MRVKTTLFYIGLSNRMHERSYPNLNRTYRYARSKAGESGEVLALDLSTLPRVIDPELTPRCSKEAISELEFAERQVVAWAEMAERLRKAGAA